MNIKDKAINLLERRLTKTALVLATRAWDAGTFYEVDLHIPDADLDNNGIQHMKCRVDQLTYRDYTISMWDTETRTCTLFVDAAHDGPGSSWVKTLQKNDTLIYLNIETHRYDMQPGSRLLLLGDQSAIGHFLALQQLAGRYTSIEGAIAISHAAHRGELNAYYPDLNLQTLAMEQGRTYALARWVENRGMGNETVYLAGNSNMVVSIRKQLRVMGYAGSQIKAQGFWR